MSNQLTVVLGLLIPFAGTALGAAMVFLLRRQMSALVQKILLGFASGVMIAASVWSLLIPAIEMEAERGGIAYLPAGVGFFIGILFLLAMDKLIPHLHRGKDQPEGVKSGFNRNTMLMFAVTLHNIPEGMAVGVVFSGFLMGNAGITMAGALTLAVGIAIQNFPEGAVIAMPLAGNGFTKRKSFLYGLISGMVEPIAGAVTLLITAAIQPALPYILAFAAGAMIYVVVEELIPEAQSGNHTDFATVSIALGFVLMMILDVALG